MLTTIENIKELPGMADNIRDKRIIPYLQEVEDAAIIPAIGAELYEKLDSNDLQDDTLLVGGYYNSSSGERKICHGLRKAVAYMAYSKMLRANKVSVTAFGVIEKTSQFSQSAETDNVNYAASHTDKMGSFYLQSCLEYLRDKEQHPCGCGPAEHRGHRKIAMEVIS